MMKITKAEKTDIQELSCLLAEGFAADPLYCHYVPYEQTRVEVLRQIFFKYLSDFWEELLVLVTPQREGVLCICPHTAKGKEQVTLPPEVQKVYDQISGGLVDEFYPRYLLLDLLAVRPAMRGKGVAKALVAEFCRRTKAQGLPGVVEIYAPQGALSVNPEIFHMEDAFQ